MPGVQKILTGQPWADAGQGGSVHGVEAAADQASRYVRNDRIAIGIPTVPPVRERCVGVAQAVVAGEVCRGLWRRTSFAFMPWRQGCAGRSGTKKSGQAPMNFSLRAGLT